ncbi:hypothetical protein HN415_06010 [Candidatus Woesearchaeota archaeon]|jgi:hypothetical protein|nr:hypothetical protein [Candidatus Woesearchaeota archaeon]
MIKNIQKQISLNLETYSKFFTKKQLNIISKEKKMLTPSEKKQWYVSIKPKLEAFVKINNNCNSCGKLYINTKVSKKTMEIAEKILNSINYDAFISGSFLFNKKYNDIDIFIISKKQSKGVVEIKDIDKIKLHFTYISKKDLLDPIIQSAAKSSVSNFYINNDYNMPKFGLFDYINIFQEIGLLIIQKKEDEKDIRNIMLHYLLAKNHNLPSSKEIYFKSNLFLKLNQKNKLSKLKKMLKIILADYKTSYLTKELKSYEKILDIDIKTSKINSHLKYYKDSIHEVIA